MATTEDTERAKGQAEAQLESIKEMVAAFNEAEQGSDAQEAAREAILEDALSVEIRSDWHHPGDDLELGHYRILLCTGGPAVQIIGSLGAYSEPDTAEIQYQDWFTEWETLELPDGAEEDLLTYARSFYFGE